jgi:hypothetical protein
MHLGFNRTPIHKCTVNAESKVCNAKTYTRLCNRCLPCPKEEGKLVSVRLGECCPPSSSEARVVLEPIIKVCRNVHV